MTWPSQSATPPRWMVGLGEETLTSTCFTHQRIQSCFLFSLMSQSRRWFIKAGIQHKTPLNNTVDFPSKRFKDNLLKQSASNSLVHFGDRRLKFGLEKVEQSDLSCSESRQTLAPADNVIKFQYRLEISECMQHVDDSLFARFEWGCRVLLQVLCSTPHILQAYCTKCGSSWLGT